YYDDGTLIYGDWRWQDRFNLVNRGVQYLNIALKEKFIPATSPKKKIEPTKYDQIISSGTKKRPIIYDYNLQLKKAYPHLPLCDYKNDKLLLQFMTSDAVYSFTLDRSKKTFKQGDAF